MGKSQNPVLPTAKPFKEDNGTTAISVLRTNPRGKVYWKEIILPSHSLPLTPKQLKRPSAPQDPKHSERATADAGVCGDHGTTPRGEEWGIVSSNRLHTIIL